MPARYNNIYQEVEDQESTCQEVIVYEDALSNHVRKHKNATTELQIILKRYVEYSLSLQFELC
jgi:hypothetical protein